MSVFGIDETQAALPDPLETSHIAYNPSRQELRAWSEQQETTTEFGSPAYVSDVKSRSADRTKNAIDDRFTSDDWATVRKVIKFVNDASNDLICVDRRLGDHPAATYECRLFVPQEYARIALSWMELLEPVATSDPDFITVQLPESDEVNIRILPETGLTCVLGSDYTGEAKKSFLRLAMYETKRRGGLGLHAGSKRVYLGRGDSVQTVGQLFLGLSATGKTTLTCHDFGLTPPEEAEMVQDDVCNLLPNGIAAGTEGRGLYIKTIGLSPNNHPELYRAATQSETVLENVVVDADGSVDFANDAHTANSRATVRRDHLEHASLDIDLHRVDQALFITRNPLVPPILRLNPAEAAAAFMLGESIETSAGDPDRAGEAVRVVGTNPFIIGDEGKEGNRFYDLITTLDIDCYVLNTGRVGIDGRSIDVDDTVSIVESLARGAIDWRRDDRLGMTIPRDVSGLDLSAFYPPNHVDGYDDKLEGLRRDRRDYLAQFDSLRDEIKSAVF